MKLTGHVVEILIYVHCRFAEKNLLQFCKYSFFLGHCFCWGTVD